MRFDSEPLLMRADKGQMQICTPLLASLGEFSWTVPAGFVTDGASIPPIWWPFVGHPYSPSSLRAAILHDWMCRTRVVSSTSACDLFYLGLRAEGCAWLRSRAMWLAVRWFGPHFEVA